MVESYCKKCRAALVPGAGFCVECGTPTDDLPESLNKQSPMQPNPLMQKTLFMGSGLAKPESLQPNTAQKAQSHFTGTPENISAKNLSLSPAADPIAQTPGDITPPGAADRIRQGESLVGMTLNNRYKVEEKIGEGGFGSIYRAEQIRIGRNVALKVLNPSMTGDAKLVERFRREAQAACSLRDPHTIITYDFDQTQDGLLYIAMELLTGRNLFEIQEQKIRFEPMRVASILEQCCSSLSEAHNAGIVHRDIKPENIVLEQRGDNQDFVKILDFGIAKIVSGEQNENAMVLTAAGQTLGTLEYMSPEQLKGQELDGRSDIYALGILAYEMLTGDLPFDVDTPAAIIRGHLQQTPSPPSGIVPEAGIPPALDAVVAKMLEKDRSVRYSDVTELRADLQRILQGQSSLPVATGIDLDSRAAGIQHARAENQPPAPARNDMNASAVQNQNTGLWWKITLSILLSGLLIGGAVLAVLYLTG